MVRRGVLVAEAWSCDLWMLDLVKRDDWFGVACSHFQVTQYKLCAAHFTIVV